MNRIVLERLLQIFLQHRNSREGLRSDTRRAVRQTICQLRALRVAKT